MKFKVVTEQVITRIYEVEAESEDSLRMENRTGWTRDDDCIRNPQESPEIVRSVWEVQ